jgi:carbamoyltransferase
MIIAGMCGGLDPADENRFGIVPYAVHDAACALLDEGEIVAAIEEERLNRIKHTNKCPLSALRHCLDSRGLTIADVDAFAFAIRESYLDDVAAQRYAGARSLGLQRGRQLLQRLLEEATAQRVDPARFHFIDHHFAHACSAYYPSGFERALIFTTDGVGDGISGSIYVAAENKLQLLRTFAEEDSLGHFYLRITRYLGFDLFDEYKVMGLAPYGDAARFAPLFAELYELRPDGGYRFDPERLKELPSRLPARAPDNGFTQTDMDVAMAVQLTLERIGGHVVEHYQQLTGLDHLCLAGGVALNCRMNGDLLQRGRFKRVFVQPAANDAGLSLGAALHLHHRCRLPSTPRPALRHVYWGGPCGSAREIEQLLRRWEGFVAYQRVNDPYTEAARLLSEGTIIGWARGRSEFGPRALGNRSILADPRPASNKDLINALVKKREAFRPFAPSALEEYAAEYFELPGDERSFPFMLFTVPVQPRHRALLGAITHVDGSARLQTVSSRDNPCYWRLIDAFRALTGVPILLNTSFNNFAEPIVETAEDSLICFLTTGLGVLFLEDWMVTKKPRTPESLLPLTLRLRPHAKLHDAPAPIVGNTFDAREHAVSGDVFELLLRADGYRTIDELMDGVGIRDQQERLACLSGIEQLWERRLVCLNP